MQQLILRNVQTSDKDATPEAVLGNNGSNPKQFLGNKASARMWQSFNDSLNYKIGIRRIRRLLYTTFQLLGKSCRHICAGYFHGQLHNTATRRIKRQISNMTAHAIKCNTPQVATNFQIMREPFTCDVGNHHG